MSRMLLSSESVPSRIRCSGRCNADEECVAFTFVKSADITNCTLRRGLTEAERQDGVEAGWEGMDVLEVPTISSDVVFLKRGRESKYFF